MEVIDMGLQNIDKIRNYIKRHKVPFGKFDIQKFNQTAELEYMYDDGYTYHHHKNGDFVTSNNNEKRIEIVWAENIAPEDLYATGYANGDLLGPGQCFYTMKHIGFSSYIFDTAYMVGEGTSLIFDKEAIVPTVICVGVEVTT